MSCVKGAIDDIFFVKWIVPEAADAEEILTDTRALHDRLNKPVRYIAVVGPHVDPPSEEVRSSMRENINELLRYCASVHLVIQGKGFRRAMGRSVATSIFLLSKYRGRTFAHDTVENALAKMGLGPAEVASVLERARAADFLDPPS